MSAPRPSPGEAFLAPGTLLLSSPDLLDPNFMHTVVLVCQHSAAGAFGVVVNRTTDARVSDLLPEHAGLGGADFPVHGGGPVGLDSLQILHRAPDALPGGVHVAGDLFLGADLDALAELLREPERAARAVRFVVGYSGWSAGQLEEELATGSWVPRALDAELVFSADSAEGVWRRALRGLGDEGAGLASQPPDPTWN